MMKIIVVTECRLCPNHSVLRVRNKGILDYEHSCSMMVTGRVIPDIFFIPSWCPLSDKEFKEVNSNQNNL
jgi:hypothetical protein